MRLYSNINMLDQEMLKMLSDCADGNCELINDIFDSFSPEAEELLETIQTSLEKKNFENLRKSTHALAGICGSVGAARMQQIASDVENLIKAGELDNAARIAAELSGNYELLKKEIHEYQESLGQY